VKAGKGKGGQAAEEVRAGMRSSRKAAEATEKRKGGRGRQCASRQVEGMACACAQARRKCAARAGKETARNGRQRSTDVATIRALARDRGNKPCLYRRGERER